MHCPICLEVIKDEKTTICPVCLTNLKRCRSCGAFMESRADVCGSCGKPANTSPNENSAAVGKFAIGQSEKNIDTGAYYTNEGAANQAAPVQNQLGMKYHNYIVYFGMFLGMLGNLIEAIIFVVYLVVNSFSVLVFLSFLFDLFLIIFAVKVRQDLYHKRTIGYKNLISVEEAIVVFHLFLIFMNSVVLGELALDYYSIIKVVIRTIKIFILRFYYKKRAHLFI